MHHIINTSGSIFYSHIKLSHLHLLFFSWRRTRCVKEPSENINYRLFTAVVKTLICIEQHPSHLGIILGYN